MVVERPALPPVTVIVTGLEPMAVKEVQEAEPEQDTEVVATEERALVPFPYSNWEEVNVPFPVPP